MTDELELENERAYLLVTNSNVIAVLEWEKHLSNFERLVKLAENKRVLDEVDKIIQRAINRWGVNQALLREVEIELDSLRLPKTSAVECRRVRE